MSLEIVDGQRTRLVGMPDNWIRTRMGAAVSRYATAKNQDPNPVVLSLTKRGIRVKTNLSFGKSTESYVGHQVVESGQFVFTPRDFDATPILCGVSENRGCISNLYLVFDVADHIESRFLEYFMWGLKWGYDYFHRLSHGMRFSFNSEQFERIPFVHPSLGHQRAIVNYLDSETGRIDALIEEKRRFIDLLREKRMAMISRAVTKGLDSSVPMKPSGQDWFGDIPAHWHIIPAKHLLLEQTRAVQAEDGVVTAFRDGQVCLRTRRRTDGFTLADKEVGYQRVHEGDLVIHTMDAFAGAVGISEDDGKATGEYAVCTSIDPGQIFLEYYAHVLRTMARRNYIYVLCPSVRERAPRFRYVRLAPVPLPVPPREEQERIVAFIRGNVKRIDGLIAEASRSIALLREKRAALITAAVTGQIEIEAVA